MDYQKNLVRKKVETATKSKISGIKMLNTIMSELGQKYTNDHIFQSLYIVLNGSIINVGVRKIEPMQKI